MTEILLLLTGGARRNVSEETARFLYEDMLSMGAHYAKDGTFGPDEDLHLPDASPLYQLVFSRCVSGWRLAITLYIDILNCFFYMIVPISLLATHCTRYSFKSSSHFATPGYHLPYLLITT